MDAGIFEKETVQMESWNSFRDCVKDITEQRGQRQPPWGVRERNCRVVSTVGRALACPPACGKQNGTEPDARADVASNKSQSCGQTLRRNGKAISHLFPPPGHHVSGRDSYMNEGE